MPGAAWAAVEFLRSQRGVKGSVKTGLKIVPVAIVYTDKARYRSRVRFFLSFWVLSTYLSAVIGIGQVCLNFVEWGVR